VVVCVGETHDPVLDLLALVLRHFDVEELLGSALEVEVESPRDAWVEATDVVRLLPERVGAREV
jgi:hypothetical protein